MAAPVRPSIPAMRRWAGLVLIVLAVFPATARGDARLRHLSGFTAMFEGGAGRMLAGDRVLLAYPGALYGWPVTGGPPRRLADLPDLGPAMNDPDDGGGFIRVEAAEPDRVVIARGAGSTLWPEFGSGHQVVVGPPRGPFADPAGCGEATGVPAALDGDVLAYTARPVDDADCADPALTERGIVVRDLAAGAAVTRVVALADSERVVSAMALSGRFLAYSAARDRHAVEDREQLAVVDLATGNEALRLPGGPTRVWTLGEDGTVVAGRWAPGFPGLCSRVRDLRLHRPGDAAGTPIPAQPCSLGAMSLDGNVLRYARARQGGGQEVVDHRLGSNAVRVRAVIGGPLVDADGAHLVVRDATCTTDLARVIALGDRPARPAGPARCPIRVRAPRRVRNATRVPLTIRCPLGCRPDVDARTLRPGTDTTHGSFYERQLVRGRRVLRIRVPFRSTRPARMTITVFSMNPGASPTVIRRTVRLRPAGAKAPRVRY